MGREKKKVIAELLPLKGTLTLNIWTEMPKQPVQIQIVYRVLIYHPVERSVCKVLVYSVKVSKYW